MDAQAGQPRDSWRDWFIETGIDPQASTPTRRLLVFHRVCVAALLWAGPASFVLIYVMAGGWHPAMMGPVLGVVAWGISLALTFRGRHTASKVLYNHGSIVVVALMAAIAPEFRLHQWLIVTLVYGLAVYDVHERSLQWTSTMASLTLMTVFALGRWHLATANGLPVEQGTLAMTVTIQEVTIVQVVGVIVGFMADATRRAESRLQAEHDKSERLLLNILPKPIAERLKASETTIADGFPQATVFFSDIVGFTPMSEKLSPQALVQVLNELFTGFDRIAARHGLEKIKTIGDAYMVAGGLPEPSPRHAHAVASFALEARDFALRFGQQLDPPVGIRIGVHTGPVVAGVIGESKFAYDLWGDTVNTASRMESGGVPGRIQCSEATWALLTDEFAFEERGVVELKGKGRMRTFFLERRLAGPSSPASDDERGTERSTPNL